MTLAEQSPQAQGNTQFWLCALRAQAGLLSLIARLPGVCMATEACHMARQAST